MSCNGAKCANIRRRSAGENLSKTPSFDCSSHKDANSSNRLTPVSDWFSAVMLSLQLVNQFAHFWPYRQALAMGKPLYQLHNFQLRRLRKRAELLLQHA